MQSVFTWKIVCYYFAILEKQIITKKIIYDICPFFGNVIQQIP